MRSAIDSGTRSASTARVLLVIVVVAVIVRVGSALYHGTNIQPLPGVTDQISYHELAVRVMNGHGFSFGTGWWPATRANEPTAHWSFLYVLFLSAVYSIVGPAPLAARLVQALVVGVLHTLLVWRIGRRLFNPAVGLAAAALTSVYGYFVFYAGALVTESFYIVAFLWVLDIATALAYASRDERRRSSLRPWILLGVALGVSALLRQVFLLVVPVILAWIAWQLLMPRQEGENGLQMSRLALVGRMAATVVVLLLCIVPWTVRNQRAFGQFVPLNTNAGFVLFWGNHPIHGTNFIPILPDGPMNYGTLIPRQYRPLNEAALDRALLLRGLGFIKADPGRYVRLSVSRAKEYFKFWPSPDSSLVSNAVRLLSFGLLVPFLLGGVLVAFTRNRDEYPRALSGSMLLLLVTGLYSLVHLLTWTLVRYRLPVDAIAMPFAGLCLVALFHRLSTLAPASGVSLHGSAH